MLTIVLETLGILKDESLFMVYARLCDISKHAFALSEEYFDPKLVCKVPKSHLECFAIKVTAIMEAKYIDMMRIDEFIGSLQTLEMNLKEYM
ncbi:hypothetical protein Godav_023799, partial [Gossypium davidsonii]|nr:hypothetical protein [Gossypium davidsonii]